MEDIQSPLMQYLFRIINKNSTKKPYFKKYKQMT